MSATISFQCYSCNQVLRVGADKAGKKAKCPKCATALTIPFASAEGPATPAAPSEASSGSFPNLQLDEAPSPAPPPTPSRTSTPPPRQPLRVELVDDEPAAAPPPPPPPRRPAAAAPAPFANLDQVEELPQVAEVYEEPYEDDYEPRRRGRRDDRGSGLPPWFFVRLGMLLTFIGSCIWAGSFLLELIGHLLYSIQIIQLLTGSPTSAGAGGGDTSGILFKIGEIVSALGSLTALVGYVFFIIGPKERGKLGLAIAVTAVASVDLLLSSIFRIRFVFDNFLGVGALGHGSITGIWFMLVLCHLLFVAELVLVPLYLRQVARDVRKSAVGRGALATIGVTAAYGGLRLLVWIMVLVVFNSRSESRAIMWITLILLWFGNFAYIGQVIWYTIAMWRVRSVVPAGDERY